MESGRLAEKPWFSKLLILAAAASWGFSFVVMKDLVSKMPVFRLLASRYTLATLVMLALLRGRMLTALRDRRTLLLGGVLGVLCFAAYATQTLGLSHTTPGKNAFFTGCYCVMVPFIAWLFGQGKPLLRHLLAAVLCVLGIGLVALGSMDGINVGDVLTLVGAVCYGTQFVALAQWGKDTDALVVTELEFMVMAVCSAATAAIFERGYVPTGFTWGDAGAMAFLVLVCSCFDFWALNFGMMHVNPTEGSILSALEAPFGVLASIIFYHEAVTVRTLLGFCLIFCAIVVSEMGDDASR